MLSDVTPTPNIQNHEVDVCRADVGTWNQDEAAGSFLAGHFHEQVCRAPAGPGTAAGLLTVTVRRDEEMEGRGSTSSA